MDSQIWAPWRMEYILGPKDKTSCVFCDAAQCPDSQLRERLVLVRTSQVYVVLNRFPFSSGHLLVIPTRHVHSLAQLDNAEHEALWNMTRETTLRLQEAVRAQGVNLGMNLGETAGAGIAEHIHMHVVPRWAGDTNFMPVITGIRVMPQYLDDTWRHLYSSFADLPGNRAPAP